MTETSPPTPEQPKKPLWKKKRFIIPAVIVVLLIIGGATGGSSDKKKDASSTNSTTTSSTAKKEKTTTTKAPPSTTTTTIPVRKVEGTTATLGAGTFASGKDVQVGLYDVTPGAGQSGNFSVSGDDSYNEILGKNSYGGVTKVRSKISDGDSISVSGLSKVTFSPVSAPLVTTSGALSLYAGTFVVGEDIGAGRYVATPGAGETGNFSVTGGSFYNEILGSSSAGGVPNVSVTLKKGDKIAISGLNQVNFAPAS